MHKRSQLRTASFTKFITSNFETVLHFGVSQNVNRYIRLLELYYDESSFKTTAAFVKGFLS